MHTPPPAAQAPEPKPRPRPRILTIALLVCLPDDTSDTLIRRLHAPNPTPGNPPRILALRATELTSRATSIRPARILVDVRTTSALAATLATFRSQGAAIITIDTDYPTTLLQTLAAPLSSTRRPPPPMELYQDKLVLQLICDGYTTRAIAQELDIPFETTKSAVTRLLGRFEAGNRAQLVALAMRAGLVT